MQWERDEVVRDAKGIGGGALQNVCAVFFSR